MLFAREDRLSVEEAMAQLRDSVLMECAMIAYKHGETHRKDDECALMIGDAIRGKMRVQR
jgi:hypothetical protein